MDHPDDKEPLVTVVGFWETTPHIASSANSPVQNHELVDLKEAIEQYGDESMEEFFEILDCAR